MSAQSAADRLKSELLMSGLTMKIWYSDVYLKSSHWKELRAAALKHHGPQCNRCPITKNLQVHHKNYRNIYDVVVDDLEILCCLCHRDEHSNIIREPRKRREPPKKKKQKKKPKEQRRGVNKPRSWTPKMIEDEIEKWKHRFRRHSNPEASAIAHVLKTRGWFIPDAERRSLKTRKRKLLDDGHPMISEATGLEASFRYAAGPF
jgi:hypothetical protein